MDDQRLFASLRTEVAEPFSTPRSDVQRDYRSHDPEQLRPYGSGRNAVAPLDAVGAALKSRGGGRSPSVPFYDLLLGLQMMMGIWPGTNKFFALVTAATVWVLIIGGFVIEFCILVKYGLYSAMFQVGLRVLAIVTCMTFALQYFGREHGFEYLVALVRRGCTTPQTYHRRNYRAAFSWVSLAHVFVGVVAAIALAVLEIFDFNNDLDARNVGHVPSLQVHCVQSSLVLRSAFRVTFLMFFSITCWLHGMLALALSDQIDDAHLDLDSVYRRFAAALVSLRNTSSSFQLVISVVLIEASVQILDLSSSAMNPKTKHGLGYLIANLFYQTLKVCVVLLAPALCTKRCADVLYCFNSRVAALHSDPSGELLAHDSAGAGAFAQNAERLARYFERAEFHIALFGVRLSPSISACAVLSFVSWFLFASWQAICNATGR